MSNSAHAAPLRDRSKWQAQYLHAGTIPFWIMHLLVVVGLATLGFSWSGFGLAMGLYFIRMFFVTGVYHRYFAHRSYKTSRWFQFVLAFLGGMNAQKGTLWWASNHRHHHKFSDQPEDLHSPRQQGTLWAHMGWIVSPDYNATRVELVRDLARFPELVWLNAHHSVPPIVLGVILVATMGLHGLFWGLVVSTVLVWHGTFTINSFSHVYGSRRFETDDDSRNNWLLAIITLGEGWHNNHHHYQSSAKQGFYWWELDVSYYVLWVLARLGLIWDLRKPPQAMIDEGRRQQQKPSIAA